MAKLKYYTSPNINLSYSVRNDLACPRYYQITHLNKHVSPEQMEANSYDFGNVDFAFGHAVGAGVQAILNKEPYLWKVLQAWDIDLQREKKGKSISRVIMALDLFESFIEGFDGADFHGWEVARFAERPAIELDFCIDLGNGDSYSGHIDIVLYNPSRNEYCVLEIKTDGSFNVHESKYGNSDQGTGYSIIVDLLAGSDSISSPNVLYLCYSTSESKWITWRFNKSVEAKLEFINGVMLDLSRIKQMQEMDFFPKDGSHCYKYNRPCAYYELCDMKKLKTPNPTPYITLFDPLPKEELSLYITLDEVISFLTSVR